MLMAELLGPRALKPGREHGPDGPINYPTRSQPCIDCYTEFLCVARWLHGGAGALCSKRADVVGECLPIRFCAQRRIICRENRRRGMATSLARLAMWLRTLTAACVHGGSLAPPRGNDERHLHQLCP